MIGTGCAGNSRFAEPSGEGMDQRPAVDPSMPEPIPDDATRGAHEMGPNRSW